MGCPSGRYFTILQTLHQAGYSWQADRTWCHTRRRAAQAEAQRRSRGGGASNGSPGDGKKGYIERAYTVGEKEGLPVWNQDEAGPYQAIPQPGASWQPEGEPARHPHVHPGGAPPSC